VPGEAEDAELEAGLRDVAALFRADGHNQRMIILIP
jgi:hypothetical protein